MAWRLLRLRFFELFSRLAVQRSRTDAAQRESPCDALWAAARASVHHDGPSKHSLSGMSNPCSEIWLPGYASIFAPALLFGYSGTGMSTLTSSLSGPVQDSFYGRPRAAPVDQLAGMQPWPLGADEPLDGRHPLIAMAFFARLAQAESQCHSHPAAFDAAALLLGRSLDGDPRALGGLDPSWLDGFLESHFGRQSVPGLVQAALPIAAAERERRTLIRATARLADPGPRATSSRL